MKKMPPASAPRSGSPVKVKGEPLEFSYWPISRPKSIYAQNPWALIQMELRKRCPDSAQAEALACLSQAQYLYRAGTTAEELAAKPLLLYYSFLNLAKAYSLTQRVVATFGKSHHGLKDRRNGAEREILDAYLEADPSSSGESRSVFADFSRAIEGPEITRSKTRYDVINLLPQILEGHQLWSYATGSPERFVRLDGIEFWHDAESKEVWLQLRVHVDLKRFDLSCEQLLDGSRLAGDYKEVKGAEGSRDTYCIEQVAPRLYSHLPSDEILELVKTIRPKLWASITGVDPYWRYYLYPRPRTCRTGPSTVAVNVRRYVLLRINNALSPPGVQRPS